MYIYLYICISVFASKSFCHMFYTSAKKIMKQKEKTYI